jgi:hypothetical protein
MMPLYMISYDLHRQKDYSRIYELMGQWNASRLLESLWLAELRGPAEEVHRFVMGCLDADDASAVIELEPSAEWAAIRVQSGGLNWLRQHIPFRS